MSDFGQFKEESPSKQQFYSTLTGKKINEKEYEHVPKALNKFEMKMMKGDHNLYLKCGTLLLADIFEKFRNNSLKNHGLCPNHYLSAPALSQDAMFNMTKIKFEIISDPDMYIFFEEYMRGRVSYISNRYSKTKNKYLKSYDPKQESKYSIYLDVNNLYGYAVPNFLSTSRFKQVNPKEFDLNKYTSNSSKGYIFEIDLEYPKEFQKLYNDYPLVPDKIEIKIEMLSDYQLKIDDLYNIPISNVKKLVTNFFDKEKSLIAALIEISNEAKKNTSRIRIQSISMAKTIY